MTGRKRGDATIISNPRIRMPTIDAGRFGTRKNGMVGLLELDVTSLREQSRSFRKEGVFFSFTACVLKALGDCVAEHRGVQAGLLNDRKLVLFDDVDISISIERKVGGGYYPFPLVLRSVNRKSILDIDREIGETADEPVSNDAELFMPARPGLGNAVLGAFYALPSALRVLLMRWAIRTPFKARRMMGTVGFATVGMAGRLSGWTFPTDNPYSLYVSLGSVQKKALVVDGRIEARDVLNATAVFDHAVVDGSPARRFMSAFADRLARDTIDPYRA